MASTFEQLVKFGTDASGLERTFRLLQSLTQILIFLTPARALLLHLLALLPPALAASELPFSALQALRARFALGRRFFRVFRFLDAFGSAWTLSQTARAAPWGSPGLETWLDISSRSFNGMYLLLETATFPEALGVDGLSVWGREMAGVLQVEGQRLWFFALVCAVGAGVVRVRRGGGWRVGRRLVADVLDLAAPGAVVGWVAAEPGTVGLLMLGSTWLTTVEVWERCGREVEEKRDTERVVRDLRRRVQELEERDLGEKGGK
ncbi:hypothetical protein B0H67DRAFT_556811 [Lasiosphaeris hirsuta]|uniref:Uncharacterized protein n=1 Tax=Lasiosphaeris hirsuta TaxID=260670 RepID=A0AA40A384_9PEZI|nr:hypothetical protein B0H67DRAFT_556811 [Lasiosphaeris hirsuta]